eukprot:CAMPEP_0119007450 /NCGR_PEP_ID=MMETSP1176-20130426/3020_1 /TAXON_ID=265551 /ORGANISM="Synedropsis recta cf, Strain CCMP1620" /LENGTH=117 /DNA_ID=CAMNT_0006959607 /DNA_START=676 /DNA_END=1025 /DNA_ORIENTATION=+
MKLNAAPSFQGDATLNACSGLDNSMGMKALDQAGDAEEDYLLSTNMFDLESSDKEVSSRDEDGLGDAYHLLAAHPLPPLAAGLLASSDETCNYLCLFDGQRNLGLWQSVTPIYLKMP